ncbi:hypothetical protein ALC60_03578 [Trachymyrmex zeteki]|uniref:Uncharacterized protein n=1 Tax=Mycetomoellerius zeteki TaxID=64791 RepID=A0A151XB80_9HYME|nr:hypothetical protein ALC60_03578 [Trachymyrmex zeteki]
MSERGATLDSETDRSLKISEDRGDRPDAKKIAPCVKRTLSLPPPSHSLSFHPWPPHPPTHIFRNIYVRREEEELDGEEREKDGDRESTGYILPPRRLWSGWRGPLGWLPHERCIRRLTGGAIKSRQQTNRQSPLCTP